MDPSPYLRFLEQSFGLEPEVLSEFRIFQRNVKCIGIASRDLVYPQRPSPVAVGLPLLYTRARPIRLATTAAILLAPWAQRNVVDLDAHQCELFWRNEEQHLHSLNLTRVTGSGQVIVRGRPTNEGPLLGLGTGSCQIHTMHDKSPLPPNTATLQPWLPKAWPELSSGTPRDDDN